MAIYVKAQRKSTGVIGQIVWDDEDVDFYDSIEDFIDSTPFETARDMEFIAMSGEPFEGLEVADWEWGAIKLFDLWAFEDYNGNEEYLDYYDTREEALDRAEGIWEDLSKWDIRDYIQYGRYAVYGNGAGRDWIEGDATYKFHCFGEVEEYFSFRRAEREGDMAWREYLEDVEGGEESPGEVFRLYDPDGELVREWGTE